MPTIIQILLISLAFLICLQPAKSQSAGTSCPNCGCIADIGKGLGRPESGISTILESARCFAGKDEEHRDVIEARLAQSWQWVEKQCADPNSCERTRKEWFKILENVKYGVEKSDGCGADAAEVSSDSRAAASLSERCAFDNYLTEQYVAGISAIRNNAPETGELYCQSWRILCGLMMGIARIENALVLEDLIENGTLLPSLEANRSLESAVFLIAQHADRLPDFQARALDVMARAHERGLMNGRRLAMLEDRVMRKREGKQLYGSQMRCGEKGPELAVPLLEPERVHALRKDRGMMPLADYKARIADLCN